MNTHHTYDTIVIGGGPAGSTVATLVAEQGHRVLLLEREAEPTFKIGESLIPATYWTFKRLGMLEKLRASHFPQKYSVQFYSRAGKASTPFYFFQTNPHESAVTWQVLRSEFDQMLLDNAKEKGVEIRMGTRVREVLFEGDTATGVVTQDTDGTRDNPPRHRYRGFYWTAIPHRKAIEPEYDGTESQNGIALHTLRRRTKRRRYRRRRDAHPTHRSERFLVLVNPAPL